MNKEILTRNIWQAIMQPCLGNPMNENDNTIAPNGLSITGEYIYVKVAPTDETTRVYICWEKQQRPKEEIAQEILNRLPEKYREHLVTIQHDKWIRCSFVPVFGTDTQAEWDKAVSDYIKAKQGWCDKYGCD